MSCIYIIAYVDFMLWVKCAAVEKSTFEFGLVNQALSAAYRTLIKVCFVSPMHNGLL